MSTIRVTISGAIGIGKTSLAHKLAEFMVLQGHVVSILDNGCGKRLEPPNQDISARFRKKRIIKFVVENGAVNATK